MSQQKKQCLDNGEELPDRMIDAACSPLKKQFPKYD